MPDFSELFNQGTGNAWLFFPVAVLLGALHGLEPGHSKTLIAAFIIAVRGTIPQAILLGLSAMVSHTAIIWILAIAALTWGEEYIAEDMEPVFMLVSGGIIVMLALWMFVQTYRAAGGGRLFGQGRGTAFAAAGGNMALAPVQNHYGHHHLGHEHRHGNHDAPLHVHHHDHGHGHNHGGEYMDAHQRAHARQIEDTVAGGTVTTGQVILFGLTGGLLPCSAAVAVLLVCMQIKEYGLGLAMVGAFSLGLAIALVGVGVITAWSMGKASQRFAIFNKIARKLPYLSTVIVIGIGVLMMVSGWQHLDHVSH